MVTDSGYGDCTLFRLGLAERGLSYAVQVDPDATAQPADAVPVTAAYSGRGRRSAATSNCGTKTPTISSRVT